MAIGRPTLLTPELIAQTAQWVSRYPYISTLACKLDITRRSIQRWYKAGYRTLCRIQRSDPDGPPIELNEKQELQLLFCRTLRARLARVEADALAVAQSESRAAQGAQWFLQTRFPSRWGRGRGLEKQLREMVAKWEREDRERRRETSAAV